MAAKLKEKVLEIASIAKECPENLQEKCFEVLLKDFLDKQSEPSKSKDGHSILGEAAANDSGGDQQGDDKPRQEDILEKDLHVKAKKFLKTYNLDIHHVNQIFYKQDDQILPLYDDLRTTLVAENQIRIALLGAFKNGIISGDFEIDGEAVRSECQMRKCYDKNNFATNFKNSHELFENFSTYSKKAPTMRLSTRGKAQLAEVIKDLL